MKKSVLILLLSLIGFYTNDILAQEKLDNMVNAVKKYSKKNENPQKSGTLTRQILNTATKITYEFSNGSVHPDYQYLGYIIVTPINVTLEIYHNSKTCYSSTRNITREQYNKFLNSLMALGIHPNPDGPSMIPGAGTYYIQVKKNNKVLFEGQEFEEILTNKGHLGEPFEFLLNAEMKRVYNDPDSTF